MTIGVRAYLDKLEDLRRSRLAGIDDESAITDELDAIWDTLSPEERAEVEKLWSLAWPNEG